MKCFRAGIVLCLMGGPALAGDWPQFRGPTGQGLAEGRLPLEWSKTRNVTWMKPIPGSGWSSPIVFSGRIYLTTSVPIQVGSDTDQSLRALCLEARTGDLVWDKEVFREVGAKAPRIHSKNTHASSTPITDGRYLYAHFGHQGTACLDLDGKIIWKSTELTYSPVHGNGGSPILVDQAIIFSCDGGDRRFVAALDRATGKTLWVTERTGEAPRAFSFSTPLLITVNQRKQVVSPGSDMVAAYDPQSGKEIWRVRYEGYSVVPRPVFAHGLVFVCTGFNTPSLLAIRPDGQGDVTDSHVAWSTRKAAPLTPSPVVVGDELYMVSDGGIASCLDAKTGQVHWQERLGGNYSASLIHADGRVYFQSEQGTGVVVAAGNTFKILAKSPLDERSLASYAVSDGAIYLRTERLLYRIENRSTD